MVKTLKQLAVKRGVSLTKLAKQMGVQPATLFAIANGDSDPRLSTVLKGCLTIPCSLRDFVSALGRDVSKIPLDAEISSVPFFVELARNQKIPLKQLAASFGIDVTGIPDDN